MYNTNVFSEYACLKCTEYLSILFLYYLLLDNSSQLILFPCFLQTVLPSVFFVSCQYPYYEVQILNLGETK